MGKGNGWELDDAHAVEIARKLHQLLQQNLQDYRFQMKPLVVKSSNYQNLWAVDSQEDPSKWKIALGVEFGELSLDVWAGTPDVIIAALTRALGVEPTVDTALITSTNSRHIDHMRPMTFYRWQGLNARLWLAGEKGKALLRT